MENSAWLTADEGLSLAGLLLALVSVVGRESRLWSRGDVVLGVAGRLGVVEPELLAPPHRFFCCFSFGQCSRWVDIKLLPFSDPEEEEVLEKDEEPVPLPEELELSPGCGAILG